MTDETGSGALVFGTAPAITLGNSTGLPISTGVSGLGSGVAAALAAPSSANLATAVTDETGSGALVFGTAPTITLGNGTGLPVSTGISGLGSGVATWLATPSSANLASAVTGETGSGAVVFGTSPTLATPTITSGTGSLIDLTDLSIADTTTPANSLHIKSDSGLTADRNIYIYRDDSVTDRWISLDGGDFGISGGNITLVTTGAGSTVTLPDSGTLVSTTGTQTLSGKTIDDVVLTHTTTLRNTAALSLPQPQLKFSEDPDTGTDTVAIQAPASVATSYTLTLPADDGGVNDVLTSNGSGVLSWTASGGFSNPMDSAGDLIYGGALGVATKLDNGSAGQILIANGAAAPVWTTLLPMANGGTNKAATAVNGGIVWSDADSMEITAAGTSQDWVLSGGAGTPTMSSTTTTAKMIDGSADAVQLTVQAHSTNTNNVFVVENSSGTDQFSVSNAAGATLTNDFTLQIAGAAQGKIFLYEGSDNGSNFISFSSPAGLSSNPTFTLPGTNGTTDYFLRTNGSGVTSWQQVSMTASVTGTLPLANGGTNGTDAAVNGGIVWSNATQHKITAAGTASDWVLSGGAGTPTMSSTTTTAKMIDMSADGVGLTIQANAAYTGEFFTLENSSGTNQFSVAANGILTTTNAASFGGPVSTNVIAVTTASDNTSSIVQQEASVNGSDHLLQMSFSGDLDATGGEFLEFFDGGARIGHIAADSTSSVAYTTTSDARQKTDVEPYPNGLADVMDMRPVKFRWKEEDGSGGQESRGFIAQEMQTVFPWAVSGTDNGEPITKDNPPMGMDYGRITPALVAALQELKAQHDALTKEFQAYKAAHP